jgi:hypothetical protein
MGSSLMDKLPVYRALRLARAQSIWRDAARVVSIRWDVFLRSEAQTRAFAFASYLAALDAEESAAVRISHLIPSTPRVTHGPMDATNFPRSRRVREHIPNPQTKGAS